jgi:prepilin-type N-terminal cleavage/methylation domain-containing protein
LPIIPQNGIRVITSRTHNENGRSEWWLMKSEKGFSLIEVLVSLAILGILSAGFLSALLNATNATITVDQKDTGRAIAQSQMEYVKEQKFSTTGSYVINESLLSEYPGYSITLPLNVTTPSQRNTFIQKIKIEVVQNGKVVTTLEDFKVKR